MNELAFYSKILKIGKFKFSNEILEKNIINDPNSNNFLGLTSILSLYNIKCFPKRLVDETIESQNLPLLTHKKNPNEIVLLENIDGDLITYLNNDGNYFKIKKSVFEENWTRNIIELNFVKAFEKNFFKNYITEKSNTILFFLIFMSSTIFLIVNLDTPLNILYLANNLCGLLICVKLYKINISQNQEGSKICSLTKKSNCLSVINHRDSKLFGLISYDKIGFLYFAYALLTPIFLEYDNMFPLLFVFAISAAFPIYSVYFQYFIAKSWCPLCLIIQINLIVNLIFLFYFNSQITLNSIIVSALLFFIISSFIIVFTSNSNRNIEASNLRKRLNLFLNNVEFFESSRNKDVLLITIPESRSIITGNSMSVNKITFITNPFCKYCSERYKVLQEIIAYNCDVKIETIYCITSNLEIVKTITIKMIDIYLSNGVEKYNKAVDDWYSFGIYDYNKWIKIYPVNIDEFNNTLIDEIISVHQEWCNLSKINATPTILFNDKLLPIEYELEDLKYII